MESRIESAKEKLNLLSQTGNFDSSFTDDLQNKLNSINTDSAESEIKSIENELKNLSNSSNQITTLNKTIDNLTIKYKTLQDNKSIKMDTDKAVASAKNLESEINRLKVMRDELSNGKFFDGSQINSQVDKANIAFTELKGSVEKVNNEFVGLNNSIKIIDGMKTSNVSETIVGDSTVKRVTTLKNELNQVQKIIETPGKTIT